MNSILMGRTARRCMCSTVLTLAALARPAAAQDARLEARLDARTRELLAPVLDSARIAGLPVEPLVQKALEGASKRADAARIALVVRRLAVQLGEARVALGASASAPELVAGASALQAGVRADVLAGLRAERSRAELTVPLGVMTELIARGVPADTAALAVAVLAEEGVTDAQLVALRRDVERDIGIGAPPTGALLARSEGLAGASFSDRFAGPRQGTTPGAPISTPRRRP